MLRRVIWLLVVVIVGVIVATQSVLVSAAALAVVSLSVLSVITPLVAIMALLVLAPMRTLIATEAQLDLPVDIGQMIFVVVVISYFAGRVVRSASLMQWFRSPLVYVMTTYVLVLGLSVFNVMSVSVWFSEWLKWLQLLLMLVIALNVMVGLRWEWLVFGVVVAALANALVGIYEFLGGSGALHLLVEGRYFRAFGTFGQPNPFGGFMGFVLPLSVMVALGYLARLWRTWHLWAGRLWLCVFLAIFYSVCSVILLVGVVASWSRGAWLGLIGALSVVVVFLPRDRLRGLVLLVSVAGLSILLWVGGLIPSALIERVNGSTAELLSFRDVRGVDIDSRNYAVIERLAHWQAALNMARDRFLFGVGFGNYEVAYGTYRLFNWLEPLGHAHNYYFNLLAETGVVGLLAYGKVLLSVFFVAWRASCHPDSSARLVVLGIMGSWCYLMVHSLFDNLYVSNLFLHFGLMLGVLAVLYNQLSGYVRLKISWGK
jgi:O-antigen ligase